MKSLYIKAGEFTPEVVLKPDANRFDFKGNSFPINPNTFYQPVMEWFNNYFALSKLEKEITVCFKFEYCNTASSRQIAKLIRLFNAYPNKDNITIKWWYSTMDIDMFNEGVRFQKYSKLNFEFIESDIN